MVVAQSGVSRSDVFLNSQIRAGGWGRWWYQSGALAERPDLNFGVVVVGDGGRLPRPVATPFDFVESSISEGGHEVAKKASSLTANGVPAAAGRSLFKGLAFLGTVPGKVTS